MPEMKKLYEEYKPKGVEFIGVSLDQPKDKGGLDKLKKFVSENQITWPQYYQGNGWESEFSRGWGINSIPTMFIVDAAGNLSTTDARGQLETLLPELLAKAPKSAETPK
jgi:alkyl hydroperoxide reductase subunit AhpC